MCDYVLGMLSQPPVLFGLPPAAVEETREVPIPATRVALWRSLKLGYRAEPLLIVGAIAGGRGGAAETGAPEGRHLKCNQPRFR